MRLVYFPVWMSMLPFSGFRVHLLLLLVLLIWVGRVLRDDRRERIVRVEGRRVAVAPCDSERIVALEFNATLVCSSMHTKTSTYLPFDSRGANVVRDRSWVQNLQDSYEVNTRRQVTLDSIGDFHQLAYLFSGELVNALSAAAPERVNFNRSAEASTISA